MPGNYPSTMRTVMNKRGNWVEVIFLIVKITHRLLKKMPLKLAITSLGLLISDSL